MRHLQTTTFEFQPGKSTARSLTDEPPDLDLQEKRAQLRLGHLSDFHLGKPPADGLDSKKALEDWLEGFERAGVDLLLVTGDLVEEPGDRRGLVAVKRMLDAAPFSYEVVPGNHDIPEPGVEGPFEELFGTYPRIEERGGLELVSFDSMKGLPIPNRSDLERNEARTSGAFSRGAVGRAQRSELEEALGDAPALGRVMLVHHHLRTNAPTEQGYEHHPTQPHGLMGPLDDAETLVDWASLHKIRLIFHGHKHNFWAPYEPAAGVVVLNSGSSILGKSDRPRRGRIVDINQERESIAVHDLELKG